ncbi:MAG: ABC transporter substrate-binding (seleno)protein SaoB [Terrisporobacter sp.]
MQWSLSSDEVDLAIVCKDAAKSFVENNKDFQIVAPLVQNSDVFILNKDKPKTIGITQNKDYQEELIKKYYKNSKAVSLIGSSLMYALENNTVEGVVIDGIKSLSIDKEKIPTSNKNDYDTYVLVANKDFMKSDLFLKFIKLYNNSVKELENKKVFRNELEEYIGKSLTDKDMGDIKDWKLKFLQIE